MATHFAVPSHMKETLPCLLGYIICRVHSVSDDGQKGTCSNAPLLDKHHLMRCWIKSGKICNLCLLEYFGGDEVEGKRMPMCVCSILTSDLQTGSTASMTIKLSL